jgi:hypothetical protein
LPSLWLLSSLWGSLFFFIIQADKGTKARQDALTNASNDYQVALVKLKSNLTDPDIKRRALEFGCAYAAMTREQNAVTVFDEIALSNDISTATAGAAAAPVLQSIPQPAPVSLSDRLRKLDELRKDGLITDIEYAARRQKIIDET